MLPPQLRKAVEAAHQAAQQQMQETRGEEDGGFSAQEHSRLAELQKQRAHLEMRQLQAEAGLLTKAQAQVAAAGLEWLYNDPKNSAEAKEREREAYLLGKPLPDAAPKADESLEARVAESVTKAAAVLLPTQDRLRKLREDPLLLIRQAELAQQQAQEANPLLQLQLKQQMERQAALASVEKKRKKELKTIAKKEKKRRKKAKSKHTRRRSSNSSSSDDERRVENSRRRSERQREGRNEWHRGRGRSRSRDRDRGRDRNGDRGRERHSERKRERDRDRSSSLSVKAKHELASERRRNGARESDSDDASRHKHSRSVKRSEHFTDHASSSQRPYTTTTSSSSSGTMGEKAAESQDAGQGSSSSTPKVYGPTLAGAGSLPAPFRVADELLPPLAIRQKALALEEARRAQAAAREAAQLQQLSSAAGAASSTPPDADQRLREMQEEGKRREAEKQRRSQLVQMKEQLEERIEAQRRALLDASEETRGLRPRVFSSTPIEPARDVTMKVRKLQRTMNDLGATNCELK
ncbi:hypothetical protein Esti_006043 [Eimeria stiedai]